MPIERHPMPAMTQERDARYYALPGRLPRDPQDRFTTVRVHRGLCDFFRNRVTVPEEDPSHPTGTSKTFNRGSLIEHLNREINRGHATAGTPRLTYGYCGGWIGGSSDRRIRDAYNAVFSHYSVKEAENELSLGEERRIERADLMKLRVRAGDPVRENERLIECQEADEKTYLEGAVTVRLYRQGEFTPMPRMGDQEMPVTKALCILEIVTRDQEINGQALIEAILADTFKGTLHPVTLQEIVVHPEISGIADPNQEIADNLIRSFHELKEQAELATPRKLCGMSRAPVEGNEVIAENSQLFPVQYPLKESRENVGGMEGVDLHVHHIAERAAYSVPSETKRSSDNRFLLRIVVRNNDVDVPALMGHLEAMRFQNLQKRSWEVGVITVALDPVAFPELGARFARRQEIIEAIRAWQPESLEGVASRRRAEQSGIPESNLLARTTERLRAARSQKSNT